MTFINPYYFMLFIVLVMAMVIHRNNYKKAFLLRIGVLFFLIIALACPVIIKKSDSEKIVYCVDISKSIPKKQRNELYSFLRTVKNDIIFFSDKANLSRHFFSVSELENSNQSYTASEPVTNMVLSILSKNGGGDAVFFTDGNFIDNDKFLESIGQFNSNNITTHIYPLGTLITNEVIVGEPQVFDNYQIKVPVYGVCKDVSGITLKMFNGRNNLIDEKNLSDLGVSVLLSGQPPDKDIEKWRINLTAAKGKDFFSENNNVSFFVEKNKKKKILHISNQPSNNFLKNLLGDRFDIVEINTQDEMTEICPVLSDFSCIFLDDVPAYWFTQSQIKLIVSAVRDAGVGLVLTGLYNSFTAGGYHNTPIEKITPVEMTIPYPKTSEDFFVLIDKSGSMAGEEESKYHIAVNAVVQLRDHLAERDRLSVSVFDIFAENIIPLNFSRDTKNLKTKLNKINAHGGTNLLAALKHFYNLTQKDVGKKGHCIILTDGQTDKQKQCLDVVSKIKKLNKTLSVIGLGKNTEKSFLIKLAELGGGRCYILTDTKLLPNIFIREKVLSKGEAIVKTPARIIFNNDNNMYRKTAFVSLPEINLYTALTPKKNISIPFSTIDGTPIIAYHRYGLGIVSVFMSDINIFAKGNKDKTAEFSKKLFNPIFDYSLKKQSFPARKNNFLKIYAGHNNITVYSKERPVAGYIISPDGQKEKLSFIKSKNIYASNFCPKDKGRYNVFTSFKNGTAETVSCTISYPAEYKSAGVNWNLITSSLWKSKGQLFESLNQVKTFNPKKKKKTAINLTNLFLILALILFVLELVERKNIKISNIYNRIHHDGVRSLFKDIDLNE
ncbi:VWA domain-containing protein [bacterium]|nr:VWA domain-containing protein [bacterium]